MSFEETLEAVVRKVVREELRAPEPAWQGYVTVAAAAKLASVSVSTIEKWSRAGLRISKRGRVRRVDVAELRAFMAAKEAEPKVDAKEWARQQLASVTPMRRIR